MDRVKSLISIMKGNILKYTLAILSIGVETLLALTIPLIIKVTIDSIIGSQPFMDNYLLNYAVGLFGGRMGLREKLWLCGLAVVLITALRGVFLFIKGKLSSQASESIAKKLRDSLYRHLQSLPYDYHVKAETGDLIQRCTTDVDAIRRFFAMQFVEIGRGLFMLILCSCIMFSLNVKMTLLSMILVPFIFTYAVIFFSRIKSIFKECDEAEGKMNNALQENLTGVRVVRAFGRQNFEIDKFDERNNKYRRLVEKSITLKSYYWSISDLMCMIQNAIVLIAGTIFAVRGEVSLGTVMAFVTYESRLLWPIRRMGAILADMGKAFVAVDRINEILRVPVEFDDEKGVTPDFRGDIEFNNVSFSYGDGKEILNDVSFNVKKGETVAILGPTGSGKSSLMHLLVRLYDHQKGEIKIDGIDIRDINKKWLRKNIGIVLQEPFLFSKTIKDNISLAKPHAHDKEVFEAASIASIHGVIEGFDNGYNTPVGEQGVTLSGGQKQRVAIARTIINDNPILVFDDSLSAVDTQTDAAIRKALKARSEEVTTFIISHRINTVSQADKIIVIESGRVTQEGNHEKLVSTNGLYKRIWDIQNSVDNVDNIV